MRCQERDARGDQCTVEGEHTEITNSKGQRAIAHSTPYSMWSVPVPEKVEFRLPPAPSSPLP